LTLAVVFIAAAGGLAFRALSGRSANGLPPTGGQELAAGSAAPAGSAIDPNSPEPLCRHQPAINGLDSWLVRCASRSPIASEGGLPATGAREQEAACSHPPSVSGLDSWVRQCAAGQK
jgi:hypothetical protein